MKSNSKLLEKKIALENCNINGGIMASTNVLCNTYTYGNQCGDKTTTYSDDNGKVLATADSSWQTN